MPTFVLKFLFPLESEIMLECSSMAEHLPSTGEAPGSKPGTVKVKGRQDI